MQPPQDSNTAPLRGHLSVLPQKPQDPVKPPLCPATSTVGGGQGPWLLWPPACRRRKALWVRPCWVEPAGLCLLPPTFTAWGRGIVKPPAPVGKDSLEGVALWFQHVSSSHTSDNPGV